jgi:hypothetical protein
MAAAVDDTAIETAKTNASAAFGIMKDHSAS